MEGDWRHPYAEEQRASLGRIHTAFAAIRGEVETVSRFIGNEPATAALYALDTAKLWAIDAIKTAYSDGETRILDGRNE
jgi:hypothetical protein